MLTELRRALPTVRALPGSAEAVPLPDACVDAVLAGNALHWFDMDVAGPEMARVLVPGGILVGLWNVMDLSLIHISGMKDPVGCQGRVFATPWRWALLSDLPGREVIGEERAPRLEQRGGHTTSAA